MISEEYIIIIYQNFNRQKGRFSDDTNFHQQNIHTMKLSWQQDPNSEVA